MTILAQDDFNAVDGGYVSSPAGWSGSLGYLPYRWRIYDYGGVATGTSRVLRDDVSADDYVVSGVIDRKSTPSLGAAYLGIIARYADDNNYIYAWLRYEGASLSATVQVGLRIAGSTTLVYNTIRSNIPEQCAMQIQVQGSNLVVLMASETLGTWDLGTDLASGVPGLFGASGNTTTGYPRLDDFLVESLAGGGPGILKARVGGAWVSGTLKVRQADVWVPGVLKRWTGTDWI